MIICFIDMGTVATKQEVSVRHLSPALAGACVSGNAEALLLCVPAVKDCKIPVSLGLQINCIKWQVCKLQNPRVVRIDCTCESYLEVKILDFSM